MQQGEQKWLMHKREILTAQQFLPSFNNWCSVSELYDNDWRGLPFWPWCKQEPSFLMRPLWICLVLKRPVAPQGKSSGTATGPLNVLSTLHVKYRSVQTPLLTLKKKTKKNRGYLAHWMPPKWNAADSKATCKWVILQGECLSSLRSWTSGCTWENGLVGDLLVGMPCSICLHISW